jgi:hypothetical protein
VKTWDVFSIDQDPEHGASANVPLVMFHTKTLNGILETDLNLAKVNALGAAHPAELPQAEFEKQVGATSRYGKLGMIRFSDGAHAEAFKMALQKAAVVCRAQ